MEAETFSNENVQARISEQFVPVSLDADSYKKFSRSVGVKGFPTSVVMDADKKVLSKIEGFRAGIIVIMFF